MMIQTSRLGVTGQTLLSCPIPGTSGRPARDGWSEMSCSDYLNVVLDDEEGATLQQ